MAIAAPELIETITVWPTVSKVFTVPHTQEEYEKLVTFLDEIIDEVGSNEEHPLASLMETLGTLIENYEDTHLPEPGGDPISMLKYLMTEHNLRQEDLPEIGPPPMIMQILHGKRELDVRQIKALSERFHVSPAVFL